MKNGLIIVLQFVFSAYAYPIETSHSRTNPEPPLRGIVSSPLPHAQENRTYFQPQEDCSNPGEYLKGILDTSNQSQNISEILGSILNPSSCTIVGANTSFSAQHSLSADGGGFSTHDPRLYIKTKCAVVSVTLFGQSLEVALQNQKAEIPLPRAVRNGRPTLNKNASGEILVDLRPFPRTNNRVWTAKESVNTWNPKFGAPGERHDTMKCSTCHNDTSPNGTKGSLGLKRITVGKESFEAIVSPPYMQPGNHTGERDLFCVPRDLRFLYRCKCDEAFASNVQCLTRLRAPASTHRAFVDKYTPEACNRLRVLLAANLCQNSQFDPRNRSEDSVDNKTCLSDGTDILPEQIASPR